MRVFRLFVCAKDDDKGKKYLRHSLFPVHREVNVPVRERRHDRVTVLISEIDSTELIIDRSRRQSYQLITDDICDR